MDTEELEKKRKVEELNKDTGLGGRYDICHCGKIFFRTQQHVYKYSPYRGKTKYFCQYSCLCKFRERKEEEQREKRRKRKDEW